MSDPPHTPTTSFPHFTHYPGDPLSDRDRWQRDAWPPDRLRDLSVTVLGLNGVGRQAALMLATLGVPRIEVVDPDTVMPTHINSEGYLEYDLATAKCDAVAAACLRQHSRVHLRPRLADPAELDRDTPVCEAVLCCAPGFTAKRSIWEAVQGRCGFFADARVLGEQVEVVAGDLRDANEFESMLDRSSDLDPERAESYTSLIHPAGVAAGLMVSQLGGYLRRNPVAGLTRLHLTQGY